MQEFRVTFQPGAINMRAAAGTTLMEAMNQSGLASDFPCGGMGKCGKCRVRIIEGSAKPTTVDIGPLTKQDWEDGIRLACRTEIIEDMVVEVLNPKHLQHNILINSLDRPFYIQAHLKKVFAQVKEPTLGEHQSDWQRLQEALTAHGYKMEELHAPLSLLRRLPDTIRKAKNQLTMVLLGSQVLGLEQGDTSVTMLGIAFDIGTTTIVGYLLDLSSGKELCAVSALNPQAQYGGDVISRITFTGKQENGLAALHKAVIEAINKLIGEAAEKAGVSRTSVYGISVAANTTMHHLFLGINPQSIALSPYVSVVNQGLVVDALELGLDINPAGQVFVLPNIAGFVGADTTAVILATEMDKNEKLNLMIDIGTNGEIVLGSSAKLAACSAAAGPAFEGAQITNGMRGAEGAIDHIYFRDSLEYTVIGQKNPAGICGSALLDGVAGLVELGMLNKRGKFLEPEQLTNPKALKFKNRLVQYEGSWAFLLANSAQTRHGRPIMITQTDIRELQLAKGAMAAGIRILMESSGITADEINEVLLAGAFGNYLNPHSACVIGLIPRELETKIRMIGNAAGTGAKIALLSAGEFSRAEEITAQVSFIELGSHPKFNTIFAENTYFKLD